MGGPWLRASRIPGNPGSRRGRSGLIACVAGLLTASAWAAPPGAAIVNRAYVTFGDSAAPATTVYSNEVALVTAALPTRAAIDILRRSAAGPIDLEVAPAACYSGGQFVTSRAPDLAGRFSAAPAHNIGEALVIRVADGDQNRDYQRIESVEVSLENAGSGDRERLLLTETGPDTGVFAGYVDTAGGAVAAGDCVVTERPDSTVLASYEDPQDSGDQSNAVSVADPSGRSFDSRSGSPLDGVTVSLVDDATGEPAEVFGSDGVSRFPATLVTGEPITDAGGFEYDFSDGRFRFPNLPAGTYRLVVTPPEGYEAPSVVPAAAIDALPGGPRRIGDASYGIAFAHDGGAPFAIDYPLDPRTAALYVNKSTRARTAAAGDFLRFDIVVTNEDSLTAERLEVLDRLPPGTRYVPGTLVVDETVAADPDVDGRDMTIPLPALASGASLDLSYVLELQTGRDGDRLRNEAQARAAGGLVSNRSVATLLVQEDLFRSRGHVVGRVTEGACGAGEALEDSGVEGVRVYLEDGRYAVSDEGGRFHFEGVEPGTHVAQLDPETVPAEFDIVGCSDNPRELGRADSQIVDLGAGTLRRVDFHLARKQPATGNVTLSMQVAGGESPDRVHYSLELSASGDVPLSGLRTSVLLPDGVTLREGTASAGTEPLVPRVSGQAISFDHDDVAGDFSLGIEFDADIAPAVSGDLVTRAVTAFSVAGGQAAKTPVAETLIRREPATFENEGYVLGLEFEVLSDRLAPSDRLELDRLVDAWQGVRNVRITAVGHSDSTRISARSRHLFADNYALSRARASAAARYLADALGVEPSALSIEGRGPDDPVASNDTAAGRQQNRRVELVLAGRRPGRQSYVSVERASSGVQAADTQGVVPGEREQSARREREAKLAAHLEPPTQADPPLDAIDAGLGFVTPAENYRPPVPVTAISIRHAPNQTIALFLNGLEVNPVNFAARDIDHDRGVAVSRWAGVELLEGTNRIVADVIAADGRVADRLTRSVHYAGAAVRAELIPESSVLVADGRTRPVLALRMLDRFGEPARHSGVGAYRVDAPYRAWWSVQNDRENKLVQLGSREPLYTIGDDGIAYIELEPTTRSGEATLRLVFANAVEQELRAWLEPSARDWILVGFGEGTVGHRRLSGNAEPLDGEGDGFYDDGRLAFFAKGRVRGDFLLTLAYDSARQRADRDEFREAVDPDRWYTLYADATEQRYEAPSQRRIYVKMERRQFNAMFGDFSTGLKATELTRYERRMNGVQSEYSGRHLAYSAFASDSNQGLVRDEIAGDGTSGLYRLSQAPLIAQSEQIRIEVRDRFDQAVVLESRRLARFLDYDLDPFSGQLFFKQPVPSRDAAFNPVVIVVEYETATGSGDDITAGGRMAVRTADRSLEVGLTHIDERRDALPASMTGADLAWQLSDATRLEAEYASSRNEQGAGGDDASARRVALEHRAKHADLRASYRDVDQAYGLGQQSAAERGVRRLALDGRMQLNGKMLLRGATSHKTNKETGAKRAAAEAALEYRSERTMALAGMTYAEDRFTDGDGDRRLTSTILDAGFSRRLFDSAMTARANGSIAIGGEPESNDYLSNYVVGMDYEVVPETELFVEYEQADGRDFAARMTRAGVKTSPWSRAQFASSLTNEMSEFGPRLYSNLGLVQGFQLSERWVLDLGLDQTNTIRGPDARMFDDAREPAFGSNREDFVAGWVGSLFQAGDWSMNSRLEYRNATTEKRMSLLSGWYREPRAGHGLSASVAVFRSERDDGGALTAGELSFGWALRRADSPWAILYRADLARNGLGARSGNDGSWRLVSNLNANRRIGSATEIALQHGVKYVRADLGTQTVDGVTDLYGADWRYWLRDRWQLSAQASVLHSWQSDTIEHGSGLSLGYNVADDLWISVGYNVSGFHDPDFASLRYTAAGPFLRLTLRAHQAWLERIARR